jgi:uncharacterized protein
MRMEGVDYNLRMPYLIDGHNLVPHLGISLGDPDDEMELVGRLQEFCRLTRKQAEVFFDDAPPGRPTRRKFGAVTAHFIRPPREADDALAARLKQLGGDARNWTVVSSDHRVQAAGRAARAKVISSEAFARQLNEMISESAQSAGESSEIMGGADPGNWSDIFKID